MLKRLLLVLCTAPLLASCAAPIFYVGPSEADSDQRRIWIYQDGELYRCADGASETQPPKPVCVRAPKTN